MSGIEETGVKVNLTQLAWTALGVFLLWAVSGYAVYNFSPNGNYGTFGDMFGAINALFSGLAFTCLIFATLMQREELKLQRKELQLARFEAAATRAEIKGQREQAIVQNDTLKKQQFENTFFEFVRLLRSTASTLTSPFDSRLEGVRAFDQMIEAATGELSYGVVAEIELVRQSYSRRQRQIEIAAHPYFRILGGTLGLIQISDIDNKQFYADILNATMSNSELLLTLLFIEDEMPRPSLQADIRSVCLKFSMFSNVEFPLNLSALRHVTSLQEQ